MLSKRSSHTHTHTHTHTQTTVLPALALLVPSCGWISDSEALGGSSHMHFWVTLRGQKWLLSGHSKGKWFPLASGYLSYSLEIPDCGDYPPYYHSLSPNSTMAQGVLIKEAIHNKRFRSPTH